MQLTTFIDWLHARNISMTTFREALLLMESLPPSDQNRIKTETAQTAAYQTKGRRTWDT